MAKRSSGKKVANSLVAMSSAAVLAVYTAGYERTQAAAKHLEAQTVERRPPPLDFARPAPAALPEPVSDLPALTRAAPEKPKGPSPSKEVVSAMEPTPAPAPPPAAPVWKDGAYTGWGSSRHGDIQASVIIEGGRIASATIAQCLTRYSCSVIEKLPPEVAQRQSPEVDYVSGATQSTNAFYYAVVDALSKAKSASPN
jgi:uncharacterized protein with FMN-binding domain